MLKDAAKIAEINQQWLAIEKLSQGSHRQAMLPGGSYINETPLDQHYNLPFFIAYAVLDEVLGELIAQGTFACRDWKLGSKMEASKTTLPWQDFALVECGKNARNALAHKAVLVSKADCLDFIRAVAKELKAWGVLA